MIRVRIYSDKWQLMTPSALDDYLAKFPNEKVTVATPRDHLKTHSEGGVRYCDRCGEGLEVTSYRD